VIGNAAYPKGPLATSLADGGLVARSADQHRLRDRRRRDVNQTDLRRVFPRFSPEGSGGGGRYHRLVYYSGYGIEFEGDNY